MAEPSKAQTGQQGDVKRWTAKRKSAVVLDLIKGKTTATDVNCPEITVSGTGFKWCGPSQPQTLHATITSQEVAQ